MRYVSGEAGVALDKVAALKWIYLAATLNEQDTKIT
jgi:hypothetical protein